MKLMPSPLAKAMRDSRGSGGNRRNDSIHMLIAVRCAGSTSARRGVSFDLRSGSSAITIGKSRAPLTPTAIAVSTGLAPAPSAETRITCPGPAHTSHGRGHHPPQREAEVLGERRDADIGADEDVG